MDIVIAIVLGFVVSPWFFVYLLIYMFQCLTNVKVWTSILVQGLDMFELVFLFVVINVVARGIHSLINSANRRIEIEDGYFRRFNK